MKKTIWISALSVAIVLLITVAVYFLFTIVYPLLVLSLEDEFIKEELNNPYIDANYDGWRTLSVENIGSFKIPENWVVICENEQYTFKNDRDEIIAYGTVVGDPTSKFSGVKPYISSIVGSSAIKIEFRYDMSFSGIEGSNFYTIVATDTNKQHLFRCIRLENTSLRPLSEGTTDFIIVFEDNSIIYNDLIEISQAVIYSYIFSE